MRNNLSEKTPTSKTVLKLDDIIKARKLVTKIYMDEKIEQYILDIIFATRIEKYGLSHLKNMIDFGASLELV